MRPWIAPGQMGARSMSVSPMPLRGAELRRAGMIADRCSLDLAALNQAIHDTFIDFKRKRISVGG
jgi:hypothetical protein